MPRALRIATKQIGSDRRASYLAAAAARRARIESLGAHFWVYEDRSAAGAVAEFTEFTEARDAAILAAIAEGDDAGGDAPVLTEVELS